MAETYIPVAIQRLVLAESNGCCEYCLKPLQPPQLRAILSNVDNPSLLTGIIWSKWNELDEKLDRDQQYSQQPLDSAKTKR